MKVELISVGTEILMGNIVNTNTAFLARECTNLGLPILYQTTVGDNLQRLMDSVIEAKKRVDLIILTGGLGPTKDDLTKEAVGKVLERKIVRDEHTQERMEAYFENSIYKEIPENNYRQADVIEGATVLDNDNGIAPGIYVKDEKDTHFILLPGPPSELIPMFRDKVVPILRTFTKGILYSKMVKISGIGESIVETKILDLIEKQTNPTIATYALEGQVDIRVTALCDDEEQGEQFVAPVVKELYERFSTAIFTTEEEVSIEDDIIAILRARKLTLTAAESCTGGLFMSRLIRVSGASSVINESFITYANKAKEKYLSVSSKTLHEYGAVSEQTAREMVVGVAKQAAANVAVAITGIAGPNGGTKDKPVGTVYIACYVDGLVVVNHYVFKGNRDKVREFSVNYALHLLRTTLLKSQESLK